MKKLLLFTLLLLNVNILLSQFVAWRGEGIGSRPDCESFIHGIEIWGGFGINTIDDCVAQNLPITNYVLMPYGPGWFGDFTDKVYFYDGGSWDPNPNMSCGGALPIELISFDGEIVEGINPVVELNWRVASQVNNDYYEIQRSKNLNIWSIIDSIPGNGTTNMEMDYSIIDYNPFEGVSYYRLKQTDHDGKTETFSPIAITINTKEKVISKIINLIGREVTQDYQGIVIEIYTDGTSGKKYYE